MNDRLMLAGMLAQGDFAAQGEDTGEWANGTHQDVIDARCRLFLRFADALLAAAGEQEPTRYSPISIVDQPVSRAEYDRQVARAEAAESEAKKMRDACDAEAGRRIERERHLCAAQRDLDEIRQNRAHTLALLDKALADQEAADAKCAEIEAKFKELRTDYNDAVAANYEWESKCADLERENAALRRRAEPLTRDELVESGDARKFWQGLTVTETIALVAAADRIRSRRSSDG